MPKIIIHVLKILEKNFNVLLQNLVRMENLEICIFIEFKCCILSIFMV